jgi:hypothetical protein
VNGASIPVAWAFQEDALADYMSAVSASPETGAGFIESLAAEPNEQPDPPPDEASANGEPPFDSLNSRLPRSAAKSPSEPEENVYYKEGIRYVLPPSWTAVFSRSEHAGDFIGDPPVTVGLLLGWLTPDGFVSPDKLPSVLVYQG